MVPALKNFCGYSRDRGDEFVLHIMNCWGLTNAYGSTLRDVDMGPLLHLAVWLILYGYKNMWHCESRRRIHINDGGVLYVIIQITVH